MPGPRRPLRNKRQCAHAVPAPSVAVRGQRWRDTVFFWLIDITVPVLIVLYLFEII